MTEEGREMEDARTPAQRVGRAIVALLALFAVVSSAGGSTATAGERYPLTFPVAGTTSYSDTWGAPRSEGRTHQGTDIFADKGTPVVAAADGTIARMTVGERAGRYIVVEHLDGWRSLYLHLDNDTPGTDDGLGGAPAPGIGVGVRVSAGDVLDYVGDSGNAEGTPSHLHFELHRADGTAVNPTPHLDAAQSAVGDEAPTAGIEWSPRVQPPDYRAMNTELVGHFDPGSGFNAGLAVHDDIAYLGTWGRPEACPGTGVRLVDVSDPADPGQLGSLATAEEFPGTSSDSVWAGALATDAFTGVVAVVAVRLCDTSEQSRWADKFRGLAIYDVTNPEEPELLSVVDSGARTQGANEVTVVARPDGTVLIGATVMQSYLHTGGELGDFRLIDATNPGRPEVLSDWDQRRTTTDEFWEETGRLRTDYHIHSAEFSIDGSKVWLAAWDGGLVGLDLTEPGDPVAAVHVPIESVAEGNAHSVTFDEESGLLVRSDEDLNPLADDPSRAGWGGQTIYDAADLRNIQPTSSYGPPGARDADGAIEYGGFFSVHEAELVDGIEYVTTYSDGLRIVDLTDPTKPQEIGSFVPPPNADPHGYWTAFDGERRFPLVWGVEVVDDMIYLTDVNSGLWVVRRASPEPNPVTGGAF